MSKQKVIAVFDIGKTNKKILLFNEQLKVVFQSEQKFQTTVDEDGFECDDIELIEKWVVSTLHNYLKSGEYDVLAVNFSTYGASLAFLNKDGERLTPIYNYLKEVPCDIQTRLFNKYGGELEFCRATASPSLGLLLNSGIQILWLKQAKPDIFEKVEHIVHFPQYLSYLLTKQIVADTTSVGCHTFLWNFDKNCYHKWVQDEGILLPNPLTNNYTINAQIKNRSIKVGIGIHDSSASLAPYILGSKDNFLLVSTGTWCINMNPFNQTLLTAQQLKSDCLSFLSINKNPVKSSRLFMGYIHDVNTKRLTDFYDVPKDSYKRIKTDEFLMQKYLKSQKSKVFFKNAMSAEYIDKSVDLSIFNDFSEAYHRLMYDLTLLNSESIDYISEVNDDVENIYVSGGFSRNEIFVRLLANFYPKKKVFTSGVDNSSALGAAIMVYDAFGDNSKITIDLGLKEWKGF